MDFTTKLKTLRAGETPVFPSEATALQYAQTLDAQDQLSYLREQFILPTRRSIKKKALDGTIPGIYSTVHHGDVNANDDTPVVYFVGNSLGAQPKAIRSRLEAHLETWASIGVNGHFNTLANTPLTSWQDLAADCAIQSAPLVGAADPSEIVIMNSLTTNLHLLMASFYRPTPTRHKILLEWRPFPSDWYAIQSQIAWHGFDTETSLVEIQPDAPGFYIPTSKILAAIDAHADTAALLLLPGIQYYSGQLFDMQRITRYAQARGLVVGWDLAHAAGNVELALHDWNVDFAVWCTYKYINAGPGAIAGAFVHARHGGVEYDHSTNSHVFRPRLAGWYGADKSVRFNMDKTFQPTPGAAGFQLSNPSAVDLASLSAALSVFNMTDMAALRAKSMVITAYAEFLLDELLAAAGTAEPAFSIITPRNPLERGAQLSILLRPGLLDVVSTALAENGVMFDARKPDVIRIAPVPMYCTFEDVWKFVEVFREAIGGSGR
ncbi:kynureninase 2 [Podospora appendiculata]|uniref:Kynureninase n=1 Tax=Podospora appendiculata TaxID=314037 RepID=A0AAE1C755_9PEZI|nr:kynureninase 2 [Podospora appendiculata]